LAVELYQEWSKRDRHFASLAQAFAGIRLVRMDPLECLISFICSSNNNIARITNMLTLLRQHYGTFLATVEGIKCYAFPTLEQLSRVEEQHLRDLGFGYRAGYVVETVKVLKRKGLDWLYKLRELSRDEAYKQLMILKGVGPKVADCVALYSLDKFDVVPVDTHVWQMATRDHGAVFSKFKTSKSMTKSVICALACFYCLMNFFFLYSFRAKLRTSIVACLATLPVGLKAYCLPQNCLLFGTICHALKHLLIRARAVASENSKKSVTIEHLFIRTS